MNELIDNYINGNLIKMLLPGFSFNQTAMKITVTKSDIANGVANSASKCPVARAIGRIKGAAKPSVRSWRVTFYWKTKKYSIQLPIKVVHFISDFDSRESVRPFSFTLPI